MKDNCHSSEHMVIKIVSVQSTNERMAIIGDVPPQLNLRKANYYCQHPFYSLSARWSLWDRNIHLKSHLGILAAFDDPNWPIFAVFSPNLDLTQNLEAPG